MSTGTVTEEKPAQRTDPTDRIGKWLRAAGWTLIWLGGLTLGFVVHQLYITTWFAEQHQGALADERVAHFSTAVITQADVGADGTIVAVDDVSGDPGSVFGSDAVGSTPVTLTLEAPPPEHTAFALIRVPSIERLAQGWNVVEGVSVEDLKSGAGHMPATPLPGQPGNAVISGHRTTYGAPFRELDQLEAGDRIEVETAIGVHVYAVRSIEIVRPTDVWVTERRDGAWLTLTTCNPLFSARERLIVFAELIEGPNLQAARAFS